MQNIELLALVGCGGFIGALIIGFVMKLSLDTALISRNTKLFLTTGMMGGITIFSTFTYETVSMLNLGVYILGVVNLLLNVILSLVGVLIRMFFAKLLV